MSSVCRLAPFLKFPSRVGNVILLEATEPGLEAAVKVEAPLLQGVEDLELSVHAYFSFPCFYLLH